MLASARIVDAIAARMRGLPLAGARVYTSRAWPLAEADLPAWRVVAVDEDVIPATVHAPSLSQHLLQVELRGVCKAVANLDDAMHALCSQALTALFNAPATADALSAVVARAPMTLRRVERAEATEGEFAVGQITVTLRVEFHAYDNAPDTLL